MADRSPLAKLLSPLEGHVYALLRIVTGLMFSFHGMQKVLGVLTEQQPEVMSQMWIGGVIELVGGLLIAVGLFTRFAAFIASGTMAVAYVQFHWKFAFDEGFLPGVNRGEMAVVYAFVLLLIATKGAGVWSLDGRR
jgi:putative oxidoreductase